MKRGYLWVDWVELGCRGWEIDQTGAELVDGENFAHLDRTTLDLIFGGSRQHWGIVTNDLVAAGLLKHNPEMLRAWEMAVALPTLTEGTSGTTGSHVVDVEWKAMASGAGQRFPLGEWTHPSGGVIRITEVQKPASRFRQWWDTFLMDYLHRWLTAMKLLERATKKAA